ncbi:MAG: N-6 DNA methylase, partial [Anaerolineae bacterium]|nr:N-6 DNA methylase [Anaerolineae bacterium]
MTAAPLSAILSAMSQPRQPSLFSYTNQGLFSDYYLAHRVRERPEWAAADAPAVFEALRGLWQGFTPQGENEAQTEEFWIRPVLRALDHHFEVQPKVRMQGAARQPDYIFFPTEAARLAVPHGVVLADTDLAGALAVGDAKAWDLPLDRAVKGKPVEVSQNPSIQIDHYIRHTGRPWGILTNGRQWRLYHRDTSGKLDVFYAVDLPALLDQGDVEAFKSFYLFFRRAALIGQPAWLDLVLSESREYERGVSDRLRDQVYDALRELAQGFLDFPPNRLTPTPDTLKLVYDSSLIVLYRLLFILYAESRGLLPVHANAAYTEYSLHALKRRVARDLDLGHTAVPSIANDWHTLQGLWTVIDQGDPHLGVPAYNGGLFDPDQHPWLERHRVGDERLRRAIDLLARVQDAATGKRDFVDYRDLEVRHLGSIYEGLLEYSVRTADTALTVRKEKGREVYAPAETPAAARVQPGQVYLVTDKGERKATGSYYTPDYIVQYIVEHTVGPVLDRLRQAHLDDAALAEAILRVNVLDPAMGSGHFLVAVTDFIARYLVGLGLTTDGGLDSEGEPAYWRRRVAQSCVYGVDLNPLAVELAKLSLWLATVSQDRPLSFLDHHLRVGNSLVGARVADLGLGTEDDGRQTTDGGRQTADGSAVSGQRSVVKGARSVVGGRRSAEARARAAGQLTWLDDPQFVGQMRAATGFMQELEGLRGETLDEVNAQKRLWAQVSESITRRYRTLADVWTARRFGLDLDDDLFAGLTQHVLRGGFAVPRYQALLDEAERVAQAQRFFHWELEFPEVFFDEHGRLLADQSGFDAVVGNPPYVRQELLTQLKPYLMTSFTSFDSGADLYLYFYEQGIRLLNASGRMSYISSGTFARAKFAAAFRTWLPSNARIETVIDFGENQPFEGAEMVRPSILVLQRGVQEAEFRSLFIDDKVPESLDQAIVEQGIDCEPAMLLQSEWTFQSSSILHLFNKLQKLGRSLIDIVDGKLYYGIKTGLNEAF